MTSALEFRNGDAGPQPRRSGLVVLVMADSAERKRYAGHLQSMGFLVTAAPDGEHGLSLLFANVPRLLVLDLILPDIDGIDLCRKAREIHGDKLPIIFLSDLDDLHVLEICLEAGGSDYLIKAEDLGPFADRALQWTRGQPVGKQQKNRTRTLAAVRAAVQGHDAQGGSVPGGNLSSDTDADVAEMTETINGAREAVGRHFGRSIEEKLCVLGYVAGVIDYWGTLRAHIRRRHQDYLKAVLRETGILSHQEIRLMISAWDEISAEPRFATALRKGVHDSVWRMAKGADFSPRGLAELADELVES